MLLEDLWISKLLEWKHLPEPGATISLKKEVWLCAVSGFLSRAPPPSEAGNPCPSLIVCEADLYTLMLCVSQSVSQWACWNDMMMGWPDDQMTGWRNDGITRWLDNTMIGWPDDGMIGWQDDGMMRWRDNRMTGWQDDRMMGWWDDWMMESYADDWPYGIFLFRNGGRGDMSKNQTCLVCPLYFQGLGRPCLLFVLFTWSSVPSEGGMQYTTYSVLKYKRSFTLPEYFPLKCRMLGN